MKTKPHSLFPWIIGAVSAIAVGCGSPEIPPQCAAVQNVPTSDRTVVLGRLLAGAFTALGEGDLVDIVNGFQGGTWIMPAMQFTGCAPNGRIEVSLTLVDGPTIGRNNLSLRLNPQPNGSLLLEYLPVPAGLEPGSPPLIEIDGRHAVLQSLFRDECENVIGTTKLIHLKVVQQ